MSPSKSTNDAVVHVDVSASSHPASDSILASFMNGIEIPKDTSFKLYQQKKRKLEDVVLHGENENIEYEGRAANDSDQKFCLGVYDPSTRSLKLVNTLLVPCRLSGKKFRKVKDNYRSGDKQLSNLEQRGKLGEEFGTRKAKAALNSFAKNRVDASKLADSELDIAESIQKSTANIPDNAQLEKKLEEENRIIPPFDESATSVEDVYPLEGIISKHDQSLLSVDQLVHELQDDGEHASAMIESLPYYNSMSDYLLKELQNLRSNSVDVKLKLQIVYYLATLIALYNGRRTHNREKLLEVLQNPPPIAVLDDALKTFSDYDGYKKRFNIDPKNEDKMLCYILALMMKLDDYQLEIAPLAKELSLKPSKLSTLLRSLGCTVKNATIAQREAMGVPKSAGPWKVGVLKVPFKLPQMTRRGRAGGR